MTIFHLTGMSGGKSDQAGVIGMHSILKLLVFGSILLIILSSCQRGAYVDVTRDKKKADIDLNPTGPAGPINSPGSFNIHTPNNGCIKGSGNRDGCIRSLRRAVDGGYFNYPLMLTDIFLDPVRDDPEFREILERAKEKHLAFRKRFF